MRYLCVKNWDEFQHYKDRDPPWIKLHRKLLDDYEFGRLGDKEKAHLILIWLFAARNDGKVPEDAVFLQNKCGLQEKPDLSAFIEAGFLVPENGTSTGLALGTSNLIVPRARAGALCLSSGSLDSNTKSEQPKVRKRGKEKPTPLPDGFEVSERVRAWAAKRGFERLDEHLEVFLSSVKAKGYVYVDWDSAFENCIRSDWGGLRKNARPTMRVVKVD